MRSPLNLCEKLGLTPTSAQYALLERYEAAINGLEATRNPMFKTLEVAGDERYESARAIGICSLWRILMTQGASGIVIAPTQALGADFMTFMEAVTKRCSPDLASVSGFPRWNVLQFAGATGWELRVMPNKAALIRERAPNALISVILSAGNTDTEFVEACKALEEHSTHPKNLLVRIW